MSRMAKWYSRKKLWPLFLICALPPHVWTLILSFNDFSWIANRTNSWDALGVISYGLLFAFVESLIVFLITICLGFLISIKWDESRRITSLNLLTLVTSLWAIYDQAHFLWGISLPGIIVWWAEHSEHPLRILYAGMGGLVTLTTLMPTLLILYNDRFYQFVKGMIERLLLLASFYLALDIVSLVIIIIRNI